MSRQKTPADEILEPTVAAIERGELDALTMKSVAERAGLSRQGLYLHYRNRSELVLALIRYTDDRYGGEELKAPVMAATTAADMLDALARFLVIFHGRLHKVVTFFHAQRWSDEVLERAWQQQLKTRRAMSRQLTRRIDELGQLAEPWNPNSAADWLVATSTVRTYEDLVLSTGWSEKRAIELTALAFRRVLLVDP